MPASTHEMQQQCVPVSPMHSYALYVHVIEHVDVHIHVRTFMCMLCMHVQDSVDMLH